MAAAVAQSSIHNDRFKFYFCEYVGGLRSRMIFTHEFLDSSTRDEKPLVNTAVNGCRWKVFAGWDLAKLAAVNTVRRGLVGNVGTDRTVSTTTCLGLWRR